MATDAKKPSLKHVRDMAESSKLVGDSVGGAEALEGVYREHYILACALLLALDVVEAGNDEIGDLTPWADNRDLKTSDPGFHLDCALRRFREAYADGE